MTRRVLHAIVGHKLPVYFSNSVRSVLLMAPGDDILIVDNASGSPALSRELELIIAHESRAKLIVRESNDISRNAKVGGLYDAYNEIMSYALDGGYDYLHIMQHDGQIVWWDSSIIQTAQEIFENNLECVNIITQALPRHMTLTDELEYVKPKLVKLRHYGLTDTGIYCLARWRAADMRFGDSEVAHAREYFEQGLRVFCHPLPTVAHVPWPAVVRGGRTKGREVQLRHQFLIRPLNTNEIARVKESVDPVWLEDVCIPWGWKCLMPFWVTDQRSMDNWYLMYRYREMRISGLRAALPRWDRRGLDPGAPILMAQRRPRFWIWQVTVLPPSYTLLRRLRRSR